MKSDLPSENVRSPLSLSPPKRIRALPKKFLLEQLELYYKSKPPEKIVETDYSLWECAETGLQFAWPMLPGNAEFYKWVSQFPSYYPGLRWEYKKVRSILAGKKSLDEKSKILDVGCGKGDFLRTLNLISNEQKFALDLNEPAIEECRRLGFHAFCGTIETAIGEKFFAASEFSAVTSFHCLEHVGQPVEFMRSILKAVKNGGSVFVSTPYSPMSFEADWFDILNHPPHHMTRWNLNAYEKLAETLGAKMRYFIPPSNAMRRALNAFRLRNYGPNCPVEKIKLAADLIKNLPQFLQEWKNQTLRRPIAADVILIEFIL